MSQKIILQLLVNSQDSFAKWLLDHIGPIFGLAHGLLVLILRIWSVLHHWSIRGSFVAFVNVWSWHHSSKMMKFRWYSLLGEYKNGMLAQFSCCKQIDCLWRARCSGRNFATRRRAPNLNHIPCVTEDESLSMRLTMKSVISRRSTCSGGY